MDSYHPAQIRALADASYAPKIISGSPRQSVVHSRHHPENLGNQRHINQSTAQMRARDHRAAASTLAHGEGCVDELLLYYAPFFMGEGIGMANVGPLQNLAQRQDWQIIDQSLCVCTLTAWR